MKKDISSNLKIANNNEISFDFGTSELNDAYRQLDQKTRDEFDQISKKEIQIDLLRKIINPDILIIYTNLNENEKTKINNLKLRDKYRLLEQILKQHNSIQQKKVEATINTKVQEEIYKQPPEELFEKETDEVDKEKEKEMVAKEQTQFTVQQRFDKIIKLFYFSNPFIKNYSSTPELEVRFGTRGIKQLTKNDYDNVVKKLKSAGFETKNSAGDYYLRINCEYLDNTTGRFKTSEVRTEVSGIHNIQEYCKSNDIKEIYKNNFSCVSFINKKTAIVNNNRVYPVNFDDFNFRVSYVNEEQAKTGIKNFILDNWKKSKKDFRFINRVSFTNNDLPFQVDISIVKYGTRTADKYGRLNRGRINPVYTIDESNVFQNEESYEIEIEINNNKIGPGTLFNNSETIANSLRNVIKIVLGGLQSTNFPISYPEQRNVLLEYMKLIWGKEYDETKRIENRHFIGPSSITLQMTNIGSPDSNSTEPNIRKDFVVTEKADGQRHLLFINSEGKIYLINMNMDVIFTGAKTLIKDYFDTLIDGELILHDKSGKFINLYAAFDIYYIKKNDVRNLSFMLLPEEMNSANSRYYSLKHIISNLNAVSILIDTKKEGFSAKEILKQFTNSSSKSIMCPIRIVCKEFLPLSNKQSIFNACDIILTKFREHRFEYETDGLIFTHSYYGVGSEKIGESGPKTKITWKQSFKWKPPKYNTIDFLITTIKGENGDDIIKPIFEDGVSANLSTQLTEYKKIQLRCGFNEKNDGYINPCQDIIDDRMPEFKNRFEDKKENDYLPKQFYPTEPYDPEAGICNIMLRTDGSGVKQMFTEENDVFTDNMIVEFSYNFSKEKGWRWIPLRVRYDKTAEYRKGEKQYGNSYKTANENWKSIHNPITEEMLSSGMNIPDSLISEDVYYNKPTGKLMTEAMKNFHNLYVKKMLITSVSKPGDILIDYACGKAGDLPKWISARLSFVFGIDYAKENLENRIDGACARYLNSKKMNKTMPSALFVHGNSAYNVKKGEAMLNDKAKQIVSAIFGIGPKDPEKIGKGVAKQYGVGEDGFHISSCQFATHYFFESPDALQGFARNLSECTKLNGYFIGTAYDGKLIFNMLKKVKTNESIQIVENGKKIWEITKRYGATTFEDDSSCIGYKIDVYQESINQQISEYLINFNYFDRIMESYGFKLISRQEANELGLPEGSGLFSELFMNMLEEIKRNRFKEKDYGEAAKMSEFEKKISFLNRYFVYKKRMEVNTEKVEIELGEYNETEIIRNSIESQHVAEVGEKENAKLQPKVRKLSKKLLLVPATDAIEDAAVQSDKEEVIDLPEKTTKKTSKKKENTKEKEAKPKTKAKKLVILGD